MQFIHLVTPNDIPNPEPSFGCDLQASFQIENSFQMGFQFQLNQQEIRDLPSLEYSLE